METVLFLGGVVALQTVTDVPTGLARLWPNLDFETWRFRVQAWSMLAGLYALAVMLNNALSVALLSFVIYHLLKGFFSTVSVRLADRLPLLLSFALVPLQLVWLWHGLPTIGFYLSLLLPVVYMGIAARGEGLLESVSKLTWGVAGSVATLAPLTVTMILPSAIHPITAGALMFGYALIFRYVSAAVWYGR